MELRCLIVDDDEFVRIDLEHRLSFWSEVSIAGLCPTAIDAARILAEEKIDLIFLDIHLPGMTGFQFIQSLELNKTQVVLVTGNKEHAADAFEYDVTDFLLKPFTDDRFAKTLLKILKRAKRDVSVVNKQTDHLFIKVNKILEKIKYTDIMYIEALADYVQIQTPTKKYTIHSTMKALEEALPKNDFFRTHNSYIVRLDKISRIEDNLLIIDINEKVTIPVSRNKLKPLMERLNTI
jgi:DNA-binding LytR/AlgR family response regulator